MEEIYIASRAQYLRLLADMWSYVPPEKLGVVFFFAGRNRK